MTPLLLFACLRAVGVVESHVCEVFVLTDANASKSIVTRGRDLQSLAGRNRARSAIASNSELDVAHDAVQVGHARRVVKHLDY